MHHNLTREGLERHIRILTEFEKLKTDGFSGTRGEAARQISKIVGIGEMQVYSTIYNHEGKLERFIKELRELGGEADVEVGDKDEVKEVQQVGSSEEEQVKLWKSLLGIISVEGYSMEQEWYETVASKLGLSGPEELQGMLNILFERNYLRKFEVSGEDGGEEGVFYLVSGDGKLVAKGEREIELEDQAGAESEADIVTTKEDYFAVMDYVSKREGVSATPLDHKLMREYLNMSIEKLEAIIDGLMDRYLETRDGKLIIHEGIVRNHGENWPIEFEDGEGEDEERGDTEEGEVRVVVTEGRVEESVIEVDNMYNLLKLVEGPGSLRMEDRSYRIAERRLNISRDELNGLLKEAEGRGLLENNDRGGLRITSIGTRYIESGPQINAQAQLENNASAKLLAAE